MTGTDEGKYAWVAINYLLGSLGKAATDTLGVIDLGGGSVQMMRALPTSFAKSAPEGYLSKVSGGGKDYNLYVHSWDGYGLMAGRVGALKQSESAAAACMPTGFAGKYEYKKAEVDATAGPTGPVFPKCSATVAASLQLEKACPNEPCSFDGVWSSGMLSDTANFHLMSFAAEKSRMIGAAKMGGLRGNGMGTTTLKQIREAGTKACKSTFADLSGGSSPYKIDYKGDIPYLCLDAAYVHALLTKVRSVL
jgi:apyrase